MVTATVELVLFTGIGVHSSYVTHVLASIVIISLGMGLVFVPFSSTALTGIDDCDAGVAGALVNTTQQIGASLGTALPTTVTATATTTYLGSHAATAATAATRAAAVVHGYSVAFTVSAVVLGAGALAALVLVRPNLSGLVRPNLSGLGRLGEVARDI